MSTRTVLNKTSLLILCTLAFSSCKEKKTGYVDVFRLVSEFELQKEYSDQAKREMDKEKAAIDSFLYVEKLTNPSGQEAVKSQFYSELYGKAEQRNREIEKMIWVRLNPYVADFGKERGYQYIYGANGTGNVLYADTTEDITDELIKYVNERYHDKR